MIRHSDNSIERAFRRNKALQAHYEKKVAMQPEQPEALVTQILAALGPRKLKVLNQENYGGEHREWYEEITIPEGHALLDEIARAITPIVFAAGQADMHRAVTAELHKRGDPCAQCHDAQSQHWRHDMSGALAAMELRAQTAEIMLADLQGECERLAAELADAKDVLAKLSAPGSPGELQALREIQHAKDDAEFMRGDQWMGEALGKMSKIPMSAMSKIPMSAAETKALQDFYNDYNEMKSARYMESYGGRPPRYELPEGWRVEVRDDLSRDRVQIAFRNRGHDFAVGIDRTQWHDLRVKPRRFAEGYFRNVLHQLKQAMPNCAPFSGETEARMLEYLVELPTKQH